MDLSYLSKHGMIAKSVPANKLKSTLDSVDGYHGIELGEGDRHKTTFAIEFGMFRYRRAPQGYLSSGDSYGRYTDAILDHYVRNESQYALLAYFPLYIFGISFKK